MASLIQLAAVRKNRCSADMTNFPRFSLQIGIVLTSLLLILFITAVMLTTFIGKSGLFDRGIVAYVSECAARTNGIFLVDVAHQTSMQLSNHYDRVYGLSFSPLGSWLAFQAVERGAQAFNRRVYAFDLESYREYTLASEYVSPDGTPFNWQPNGKYLGLRMVVSTRTRSGMEDLIVDVASGAVISAVPISALSTMESNIGGDTSGTVHIPFSGSNTADTMNNNRVDIDVSSLGDVVRSWINNGAFDLHVQFAGSDESIQVTYDSCNERYPRWQP